MARTSIGDVFVPEIATEVATAQFPTELALSFAGSPFVTVFPPEANLGNGGDAVKFPRWNPINAFSALAPGGTLVPEKMDSSLDQAVVQVGGKAVEIEDFASLSGKGDPSEEAGRQIARRAAEYIDDALIAEAETTIEIETDAATITWALFVEALVQHWGDKAMSQVGGLVVHSKVMGDLMKLDQFIKSNELGRPGTVISGFVGNIGTYPVYVSDRITTASGPVYSNLILKRGALGLKFQRELLVEEDRDILAKSDVISADVRFAVHLMYADPSPVIKWVTQ